MFNRASVDHSDCLGAEIAIIGNLVNVQLYMTTVPSSLGFDTYRQRFKEIGKTQSLCMFSIVPKLRELNSVFDFR